ncbi:aldolase/citrate lyase family protein [Methylosinus sp. PW1]|uniref:aldolase/citrate lyase family protein n=1 Tax=Methylosinus sp. PW1 TaxID=107636 RepID=UPI000559D7A2|nr:aldolase/citrate lyase family protein [Methylosinus sp. PW1]
MRSFLLIAPREEAFSAALASGADALAFDLGDSADPARESMRRRAAALIAHPRPPGLRVYALIAPLAGAAIDADLAAIVAAGADGVFLPQACGGASVQHLSAKLAVAEAECGRADGATRIIALATQTPAALFALSRYGGASSRLEALAFDTEPLRRALGATSDGAAGPSAIARSLLLLGAAAAGVAAIDAPFADLADAAGLAAECRAARRDGFAAKLALDLTQIPPINQTFAEAAPAL